MNIHVCRQCLQFAFLNHGWRGSHGFRPTSPKNCAAILRDGRFMAVSGIDSVYCLCPGIVTSSNGIDWVAHKDVSSFPVYAGVIGGSLSIAIAGDYTGCCFAGHLYSSRDGRQWTHQELGPTAWFTDAAYGGGVFVLGGGATASGVGGLLTSRTGLSWDRIPFPSRSGGYEYIQDISYSRGRFIILSGNFNYSHVYTSSDGSSWDYVATSNLGGFTGLALCDDIYLAVGPKGLFSSCQRRSENGVRVAV